jgi:hypothetical protein
MKVVPGVICDSDYFGQIILFPLYPLGLFQSLLLSIKPSNVPLYLLKMYNLPLTVYFSVKS